MAYRVEKIAPVDIDERKAVGIKLPFSSDSVFTSTYQTLDAYKTNLINYLLTNKGERYFNPDFGSNIRSLLFEPSLSELRKEGLKSDLIQELSIFFPKLVVDTVEISDEIDHVIQIYLKFHIRDSRLSEELVVNFE